VFPGGKKPTNTAVPRLPRPAPLMQRVARVHGTITGKDVILHSFTIVRLWGPGVYVRLLRALMGRRHCTFLGVLFESR
jgi:hypothetical protein